MCKVKKRLTIFFITECHSTNSNEKYYPKTIDNQLKIGEVCSKKIVGDDGRNYDDVANNSSIGQKKSINIRKPNFFESQYQNIYQDQHLEIFIVKNHLRILILLTHSPIFSCPFKVFKKIVFIFVLILHCCYCCLLFSLNIIETVLDKTNGF